MIEEEPTISGGFLPFPVPLNGIGLLEKFVVRHYLRLKASSQVWADFMLPKTKRNSFRWSSSSRSLGSGLGDAESPQWKPRARIDGVISGGLLFE